MPDFNLACHGSIYTLYPVSDAARAWIDANLPQETTTWAGAIVVEHRYITDIVAGAQGDGLTVDTV